MQKRHPSKYREIYDNRGENIGMYLWVHELHNDVNRRLISLGEKKTIVSKAESDKMWEPLLSLTTEQIEESREAAMSPDTMGSIYVVEFHHETENAAGGVSSERISASAAVSASRTPAPNLNPAPNPAPSSAPSSAPRTDQNRISVRPVLTKPSSDAKPVVSGCKTCGRK